MKGQRFKVVNIPWKCEVSHQSSIELETANGQRFTCFNDGYDCKIGKFITVHYFGYFDETRDFDTYFKSNPKQEKSIVQTAEWDYDFKGQIIELEKDTTWVDCGGVIIPIEYLTHDKRVIGDWVGFSVSRLEIEAD